MKMAVRKKNNKRPFLIHKKRIFGPISEKPFSGNIF